MERIKRQKSISRIFALYIICFCIVTIFLAAVIFILFGFMIQKGIILPANYYEQHIEQRRDSIAVADDVSSLIPEECSYAVFTADGKMIQGNVSENKALYMWKLFNRNKTIDNKYFYKIIQRKNGICMVEYMIVAKFANPFLQKYLPNAEICSFLVYIIIFIMEVIIFSKCFSRRFSKEMKILKDTTENIQMENLDFIVGCSNILEINDVLSALNKMKTQLQNSLNEQWKIEQARKEQMAALAHDIKTPLTILRGNTELLEELNLSSEQKVFTKNILNEGSKMESYIKSLIEIMKSEKEISINKKQVNLQNFIDYITEAAYSMTMDKGIKFIKQVGKIPQFISADEAALQRALINIISNAVDYTPSSGEILFQVDTNSDYITFVVEDSGKGFTQEELKHASEQFFQGDKSRTSKDHYGMGLYIAKEFLKQHNGNLYLENSKKTGGARVILDIPISL